MHEEEAITPVPDKEPGEANSNPRTQTEEGVRGGLEAKAETDYSPGGSHVFYRTQYGSNELPGMKTKVSRVRETPKRQTADNSGTIRLWGINLYNLMGSGRKNQYDHL